MEAIQESKCKRDKEECSQKDIFPFESDNEWCNNHYHDSHSNFSPNSSLKEDNHSIRSSSVKNPLDILSISSVSLKKRIVNVDNNVDKKQELAESKSSISYGFNSSWETSVSSDSSVLDIT